MRICGSEGGSHQGPLKFPRFPKVADLRTPTHKGPAAPENRLPRVRPPKTPRWRVRPRGSATRDRSPVPKPIELSQTGRLRLELIPRSGSPGPGSLVCGCGLVCGCPGINSLERKLTHWEENQLTGKKINSLERKLTHWKGLLTHWKEKSTHWKEKLTHWEEN